MYETLFLTVGKSYAFHGDYEFILSHGDEVVYRENGFPSYAKARRAGMKKADSLLADSLFS